VPQVDNFFVLWIMVIFLTALSVVFMSGAVFIYYYVFPTYEKWTRKSNPVYPEPHKIRDEIIQTAKGLASAALCPAFSIWILGNENYNAYCGVGDYGYTYLFVSAVIVIIGSDFFEFYYHRIGHLHPLGWTQHKHHHVFHNPSPFSVIADEYIDQFVRATPLVWFPWIMPVNIDLLYAIYGIFFYAYGVALHCGHEFDCLSAHSYWINTPHQHYLHHARSIFAKPYHTGFFVKIWDRMFGSLWDKDCLCTECARAKGLRSREIWEKIKLPDYSVMLSWKFWWNAEYEDRSRRGIEVGFGQKGEESEISEIPEWAKPELEQQQKEFDEASQEALRNAQKTQKVE